MALLWEQLLLQLGALLATSNAAATGIVPLWRDLMLSSPRCSAVAGRRRLVVGEGVAVGGLSLILKAR